MDETILLPLVIDEYSNADAFRLDFGIDSLAQAQAVIDNTDELFAAHGQDWENNRAYFDETAREVKRYFEEGRYKEGELAESKPSGDGMDLWGDARHVANDSHDWKAVCSTPDFCKVGNAVVPFDSFATLGNQATSSPDVKAQGVPVYRVGDMHKGVQGDAGSHIVAGTSLGAGYVKFLQGQDNIKVNGIPLVRQDSLCLVNCNAAGIGGALGKVVTTERSASTQAEQPAGQEANPQLQALLDEEADQRSLWEKTTDFGSNAWSSTKRIASASLDDPLDTLVGVLKGIGNLPSDLWNFAMMAGKYGSDAGIPPIAVRADELNNAALAAHKAGNLAQANELARQADEMMSAGYIDDFFPPTSDAQKGGAVLSMAVPLGSAAKGAGALSKAAKGAKAVDSAADTVKAADAMADAGKASKTTKAGHSADAGKAESPGVHIKAAAGEQLAHERMLSKNYEPLGKTDGAYKPGANGIDGVYRNPSPPPEYIITEVKYGSAQLHRPLADGSNQMDDAWAFGSRLDQQVGRRQAELIREAHEAGGVEKWLVRVKEDGSVSGRLIDSEGYVVKGNAGKVF